ncbi:MAG: nitrogen fixation protein NifZ [Porticoccaceae bacterium]
MADGDIVELGSDPVFEFGEKVQSRKTIRNDGTYVGKEIGAILVRKGDVGYVSHIGTFLQQFYIYGVDFLDTGHRVGMKAKELASLDRTPRVQAVAPTDSGSAA